jgi:hypothetical protein
MVLCSCDLKSHGFTFWAKQSVLGIDDILALNKIVSLISVNKFKFSDKNVDIFFSPVFSLVW